MRFVEAKIKQFGKFREKDIEFSEGINLVSGANEAGKSTLHAFLRAMLFGLARGRGRAAAGDAFTQYEPWDMPGCYAGALRFGCGGKMFCIDRQFDRYGKKAEFFCEDDGEQLSVTEDLKVLLGGLNEQLYDNTISIGQLRAPTGEALAQEMKQFAAEYYAVGNEDLDLEKAVRKLQEQQKETTAKIRDLDKKNQAMSSRIEQELEYLERDIDELESDIEQIEEQLGPKMEAWNREKEKQNEPLVERMSTWRIHPIEVGVMIVVLLGVLFFFPAKWNYLIGAVVALAEILYVWNKLKEGVKIGHWKQEAEREELDEIKKLQWNKEHCEEELKDRILTRDNLIERAGSLTEKSDEKKALEQKIEALELAIDTITRISDEMRQDLAERLNQDLSALIGRVTGGKYQNLIADPNLSLVLRSEGKYLMPAQVSRGTMEQLYLCLRLAAADILFEEELPIVLDDTFAYYDDERLAAALKVLHESGKQVLLFTCHTREERLMREAGIPFRKVRL